MENGKLKSEFDVATALEESHANVKALNDFLTVIRTEFFKEDEAAGKSVGDVSDSRPSVTLPYPIDAYKIQGIEPFYALRNFCANPCVDAAYSIQTTIGENGQPATTTVTVDFDRNYRESLVTNVSAKSAGTGYKSPFGMFQ